MNTENSTEVSGNKLQRPSLSSTVWPEKVVEEDLHSFALSEHWWQLPTQEEAEKLQAAFMTHLATTGIHPRE